MPSCQKPLNVSAHALVEFEIVKLIFQVGNQVNAVVETDKPDVIDQIMRPFGEEGHRQMILDVANATLIPVLLETSNEWTVTASIMTK